MLLQACNNNASTFCNRKTLYTSPLIIGHIEGIQNLLQVFVRERVFVELNSLQLAILLPKKKKKKSLQLAEKSSE